MRIFVLNLTLLLSSLSNAQIINNGSFENTLNNNIVSSSGQFKDLVNGWTNGNEEGSPDLYSRNSSDPDFDIPKNISTGGSGSNNQLETSDGDNYAGIQTFYDFFGNTTEYIKTQVTLNTNTTYRIKFKFSCAFTAGYYEKIGALIASDENFVRSFKNFITPNNSDLVLCSNENSANYNAPGVWYEYTSTFHSTTAGVYALFIGSFKEQQSASSTGRAGALSQYAYYLIDDVSMEVITFPCCPVNACYTNTSSLPSLTFVSDFIKSGNAEGCFASNTGPVTITSGQNVVFNAGSFIEIGNQEIIGGPYTNIAGMDIQQGAIFDAFIEGCNSSNSNNVPPIHIITVPNIYIRGLPNPFYVVEVENATEYEIEIKNQWGAIVFQSSGSISSNKALILMPPNISAGEYIIILTFSNCNSSISLSPFWMVIVESSARESESLNNESIPIINMYVNDPLKIESDFISIYPNPIVENLNIMSGSLIKEIRIFDCTGKSIKCVSNLFSYNLNIDLRDISSGLYAIVIIRSDSNNSCLKFIKN